MKGLNQNTRPKKQPKDTYRYGKNGLSNVELGLQENEPGFVKSNAVLPYKCIGIISSPKYPILFCTDNVNSAVGYFNTDTDSWQEIINDQNETFKLNFHSDYYITGQSQRNHLGEIVVAFTDKHKVVGYLNCDNPSIEDYNDLSLFPIVQSPGLAIAQDSGGILAPGAYFALVRYTKKDGTITSFVGNSAVTIVSGTSPTGITDQSLRLTITNIDQSYDFIQVAIIFKVNGVYQTPQLLQELSITDSTMEVIYSGTEATTDISLEEVLIPQPFYEKVGCIGQLNDYLYLGNLESEPTLNMQPYANLVQVKVKSELMDTLTPDPLHVQGQKRSFMHEEVVALYIQYSLTRGGWSQWFHIPGRAPVPAELLTSAAAQTQGIDAKVFQVEDTVRDPNVGLKECTPGYWENENEEYPNHPDFDSSGLGGLDLRGQKVRHHRMPSLTWCKENFYPADTAYGKNKLDLLGLTVYNVIIPTEYANRINGWRIGFGKRTLNNATVIAQGALLHNAQYAAYNGGAFTIVGNGSNFVSTGGNFHAAKKPDGNQPDNALGLDRTAMRFHGFDLLFNRPQLAADGAYLSTHLKIKRNNIRTQGFIEDNNLGNNDVRGPVIFLVDYLAAGLAPTVAGAAKRFRKLSSTTYVQNNAPFGIWNNTDLETAYVGKLNSAILDAGDVSVQLYDVDENNQSAGLCFDQETSFLTNIMRVRTDVYAPFTAQKVVQASDKFTGNLGTFFGGDTFIVDYTFHTYGWWMQGNQGFGGKANTKIIRRIACETAANLYGRYEIVGNIYSKWYPKSPIVAQPADPSVNYLTEYELDLDPNQFGYNKDLNALNELITDTGIYNTNNLSNTIHPFRIHRGGKLGRQDKTRSWRTFLPLDYYEIKKQVGPIINIDGQDDRLLIHCLNALLLTQDKTKLETDVLKVTLGSADIFQFEPQDGQSAPLGYAGTSHDLSCIRTPAGYLFADPASREVFLYKGQLQNIGAGLYNTMMEIIKLLPSQTNTFIGDGITVGYDPQYKRFLFTAKQSKSPKSVRFNLTDEDIPTLVPGEYVFMHGRILEFMGVNDIATSGVSCVEEQVPIINSFDYDLLPAVYTNYEVFQINGVFVNSVTLLSTVPIVPYFTIDPVSRKLFVNGTLPVGVYQLNCRATSPAGTTTDFYITINVAP